MDGEKIHVLNRSIQGMLQMFAAEDSARGEIHLAVIAFGGDHAVVHQPLLRASQARWVELTAQGRTPMGGAFQLARSLLEDPTNVPKRAFPPSLILVSDGLPTDDWEAPLTGLLGTRWGTRALRLALGIGVDRTSQADEVLTKFSTPGINVLRSDQVHEIPAQFRWVTATVTGHLRERTVPKAARLEDLD
jgi:uncharacterized protein YegL